MTGSTQMPTIKIASEKHPARAETNRLGRSDTFPGGIYHTRSISRASFDRRSFRSEFTGYDAEDGDDTWRVEHKEKQVFKGRTLLWLAYSSIGVIYGDIGTSPLYVFSSTFTSAPTRRDLLQVLSVIIWSLALVVTVKYVLIILRADNEGEGGTFSCYSLLSRFANLTERDPREEALVKMERHLSGDLRPSNRTIRAKIENSIFTRGLLKAIGVLAVSMVMSDGVLTPAQSVLGAVQGLNVVKPDISSSTVVGTTCGILVLLFAIQPFGIAKLSWVFSPIVATWLAFNFGFGVYNLAKYDWQMLKAFSPHFAFQFFVERKSDAWRMLGGVLLSFTGVEALFADLGAFSMRAIQLSWLCYTFPCILLAYIGQAAYISLHPDAFSNPFYNSLPPGMLYPSLVVAVLAAIVASQAIITATFQLTSQIMKLSYCPQVQVVHTSSKFHGQLYVPFINWLLLTGAILVTCVYSNTTRLGNAYGVCVMFVTFFDTCMVTLVALVVWKLPVYVVVVPWLVFACLDGLYLSSALIKVPDGAWFTLTLSAILASLFLLWRFGKENQWRAEAEDRIKPAQLIRMEYCSASRPCAVSSDEKTLDSGAFTPNPPSNEGVLRLTTKWGGDALSRIRAFGIFFDKTGVLTPAVFTHFVTKFVAVPEVMVFFHLHPVQAPTVPNEERYAVTRFMTIPGCYRLVVKHGFMDEVVTPDLAGLIYERMRLYIVRQAREKSRGDEDGKEEAMGTKVGVQPVEGSVRGLSTARSSAMCEETTKAEAEAKTTAIAGGSSSAQQASDSHRPPPPELSDPETAAELARLERAFTGRVMYIIGKEQMRVRRGSRLSIASVARTLVLTVFLWIRENTRAKIANLRLAMDRVVEVGFVKEI